VKEKVAENKVYTTKRYEKEKIDIDLEVLV